MSAVYRATFPQVNRLLRNSVYTVGATIDTRAPILTEIAAGAELDDNDENSLVQFAVGLDNVDSSIAVIIYHHYRRYDHHDLLVS